MKEVKVRIGGMHCASCADRVQRCLLPLPGVKEVQVQIVNGSGILHLETDPAWESMNQALKASGYSIEPWSSGAETQTLAGAPAHSDDSTLLPAAMTLTLGALLMALMALLPHESLYLPGAALALFVQIFWGKPFVKGVFRWIRGDGASMETLVGLGTLAALGLSLASPDHPYFEVSVFLIGFVRLGKWLENRAKTRTGASVRQLLSLTPPQALRILQDGSSLLTLVSDLHVGERIRVMAGERIPTDGHVVHGHSSVDESWLTGESLPVEKQIGSKVLAGSLNQLGLLEIDVTATSQSSLLAQIIGRVESAQMSRAPIQRIADQVAARFVPAVLIISVLTLLGWLWLGQATLPVALIHAVAVLVIACPCALGLATPAALVVGLGRASENSILFKSGTALETLARAKTFVFDKTGTLTVGRPTLRQQLSLSEKRSPDAWLSLAASAERGSEHPLAGAFAAAAQAAGLQIHTPDKFQAVPGQGLRASIAGEFVLLGNERFLKEQGVPIQERVSQWIETQANEGATSVCLAHDFECVAVFSFEDSPREGARALIQWLEQQALHPRLLSGDRNLSAQAIGIRLGFQPGQIEGEVLPHQKESRIVILEQRQGPVVMIGDGINDAPALARASVSVSLHGASQTALDSAQVLLMSGRISELKSAILLSRATLSVVRQNLAASAVYNLLGIPLAAGVFERSLGLSLSPALAGAAMALSSVSVVLNSLRLKKMRIAL